MGRNMTEEGKRKRQEAEQRRLDKDNKRRLKEADALLKQKEKEDARSIKAAAKEKRGTNERTAQSNKVWDDKEEVRFLIQLRKEMDKAVFKKPINNEEKWRRLLVKFTAVRSDGDKMSSYRIAWTCFLLILPLFVYHGWLENGEEVSYHATTDQLQYKWKNLRTQTRDHTDLTRKASGLGADDIPDFEFLEEMTEFFEKDPTIYPIDGVESDVRSANVRPRPTEILFDVGYQLN